MAKVDDPRPPGWDEPPLPLYVRKSRGNKPPIQRLSIRQIMVALIYFAIVFWAGKHVLESDAMIHRVLLGTLVGLGFCAFGIWAAMKLPRYSFIGWTIFVLGYLGLTAATTSYIAIGTVPILIGAIIYLSLRRRANNQDALLWVLTVAAEREMPLAPGVQAFSSQVLGIFEVWTESLAELLRRGATLPDALDSLPKVVPPGTSLLIRMGWESGNLACGLREAVNSRTRHVPILQSIGARIAYLCWLLFVAQSIVGFVMYFIVPKFEAIFKDFGVALPEVTILVIQASHTIVDYGFLFALFEFVLLMYLIAAVTGWSNNTIPLFDRLLARRHTILILRALAVVIDADRPIGPALYAMGESYPTRWVRKKLIRSADDAHQGVEWTEALFRKGLLSANDVGVLASAQKAGNLAWALRELAETGERRWGYRLQAWTHILFALTMLAMGGLVFVISVAYFAPLTTLISRLSQ